MASRSDLRYAIHQVFCKEANLIVMRLESIKLAGFKSFVDPTVLELRSPLVAVVGPNGCGKSNIIDAIRWVMGESSAKNLRGESMSDVIFNGSVSRKPVGQASIELVFDNSDGSLGGEYARYNQIAVRRQAGRDGQSSYFLNGTRCRRKDITDIFLGTGLGPRSYAIIEQGMISRVIEAKPEELRSFLEEAAGISLYRKRRQETETRMRHTRENLDRLNDIRQELEKQIERLKRQSEAAIRYRQFKEEHDRLEGELSLLRWQVYNEQLKERAGSIRQASTQLEEKLAIRTSLDLELEKQRLLHIEKMDAWKIVQGNYYELGTEVARIEQTLAHHREREQTLDQDIQQTKHNYQDISRQIEEDEARLLQLKQAMNDVLPNLEVANKQVLEQEALLIESQEALRVWEQGFQAFQQDAEKPQRTAEVEKARIEQLERQSREAKMQYDRLQKESADMDLASIENQLAMMEQDRSGREAEDSNSRSEFNTLSLSLAEEREKLKEENRRLEELRVRLQTLRVRMASLEALQQAALGKTQSAATEWLENNTLSDYSRLGEMLTVEKGYERAVETVLGNGLEAVCIPDVDLVANKIDSLIEGNLTFLESSLASAEYATALRTSSIGLLLLATKIKTEQPIGSLLANVYVAESLQQALAYRKKLQSGESIITLEGIWIGQNWIRVYRGTDAYSGVLSRENELKEAGIVLKTLSEEVHIIEGIVEKQKETIQALESKRESLLKSQQEKGQILNQLTSKISAERSKLDHARNRMARLATESTDQKQKCDLAEEEIAIARMRLQTALDEMEVFLKRRSALTEERETLREVLQRVGAGSRLAKEKAHILAIEEQTLLTQRKAVEEGVTRLTKQRQIITERVIQLQTQLQGLEAPSLEMRENLEALLAKRVMAEDALNRSRGELDEIEQGLRALEKQRHLLEEEAEGIRQQLETCRMEWQAIEVRCQTVQEKIVAMGKTVEELLQTLPAGATEAVWAVELEQVTKRIDRLGAINLAAIEEFQSESERKEYLDLQHKDLIEALETLEGAIRKIDKETRVRFKETFEKVNAEFQVLFPVLFGGGEAYLELVGEDLLEAGVSVMARPPGKRNSSIHLLSGGEKALTAVAMVFAIFQLNPAPFCILDEVDAPLDDANVGRFCELVKKLSQTVQFIFVTHNKLAMEIAHHLVGVTMKEPGVSRLVSVDVQEAAALVAS